MTHLCRSVGKKEQHVHFQAGMKLQTSKEEFLVTVENMDPFIKALGTKIQGKCRVVFSDRRRCKLYYCLESFRIGKVRNTSVIGEDTNVLVILSFFVDQKGQASYFHHRYNREGYRQSCNTKRFAKLFRESRQDIFLHAL